MKKSTTFFSVLFTVYFFCMSQISFSQENNSKNAEKKPIDNPKKATTNGVSGVQTKSITSVNSNNSNNAQKQVDTQGKSFQLDENDAYQGRTEEFLSQITLKELPVDFPKYEKWMGVRHYNEVVSDYYKKHLDILIPSVKQKLTQTH